MGRLGKRLMGVAAAAAVVAAFSPATAGAAESVLDGSFDAVTACTTGFSGDCTSQVWDEELAGDARVGPLCQAGVESCGFFEGPSLGPHTGPTWAQFGGEDSAGPVNTYALEQVVNVPVGPKTLGFQLTARHSSISTGGFTASIDGTPVFAVGAGTPGYSSYAPVSIDISAFAGGLRTLRFQADTTQSGTGSSDSYNLDDVSITDRPVSGPTGLRAAALKKCKKKHSKKKRKKCRKKAKKLPL
jgi:hypothetical protein